jgi:hypothetical protein
MNRMGCVNRTVPVSLPTPRVWLAAALAHFFSRPVSILAHWLGRPCDCRIVEPESDAHALGLGALPTRIFVSCTMLPTIALPPGIDCEYGQPHRNATDYRPENLK